LSANFCQREAQVIKPNRMNVAKVMKRDALLSHFIKTGTLHARLNARLTFMTLPNTYASGCGVDPSTGSLVQP